MKMYEAIGERIAAEGVRSFFGLMGDGNLKLIPHLVHERGVSFYGARHEAGAVAMADGYARASGEVGVCTFTQGPGLTNAITALVTARRGRMPLVAISGDTPTVVQGLPQDIEQRPFWEAADVPVQDVRPGSVAADVAAAFHRARTERRPIALNLPTDLQETECPPGTGVPAFPPPPTPPIDEDALERAAEALTNAQRPVVIGGRGALEAGVRDDLVALADHAGALLATTLPVNAWFSGHPYDVGIAGGFANETGRALLGEADVVVAFGAGLNHFTSRGGTLFAQDATIIQVDVDPTRFGRYIRCDIGVTGDAGEVARALRERVSAGTRFRTPETDARIAAGVEPPPDESDEDGMDPRTLSRRIAELVTTDRTLVIDGGHFMGFPSMDIPVGDPSRYVFTLDFGSIGLGLGAAVGAAVAHPDRLTIAAVGDGGLMLSLGELDSAVRYRLPILVLVYNDNAYGAEMHFLRMSGIDDSESRFVNPPLDQVARAMGADGYAVRGPEDLDALAPTLRDIDGPVLLDCRVTERVRAVWLEEAFQRGTH
jgi:thiamine pyrophosphate-dependent acetolactate synthase large subunit-like protein